MNRQHTVCRRSILDATGRARMRLWIKQHCFIVGSNVNVNVAHHAGRRRNVSKAPFDNAPEPNDRALPFSGRVGAENVEFWHGFH